MANSWKTKFTASLGAAEVKGRTAFPTFGDFGKPPCVPLLLSTSSELPSLISPPQGDAPTVPGGFSGLVRLCHPASKGDLCPKDSLGWTWRRRMSGRVEAGAVGCRSWKAELGLCGALGSPEDGSWCHFLTRGARLQLRRGSSCCPRAEDGKNRPSRNHLTQPGWG